MGITIQKATREKAEKIIIAFQENKTIKEIEKEFFKSSPSDGKKWYSSWGELLDGATLYTDVTPRSLNAQDSSSLSKFEASQDKENNLLVRKSDLENISKTLYFQIHKEFSQEFNDLKSEMEELKKGLLATRNTDVYEVQEVLNIPKEILAIDNTSYTRSFRTNKEEVIAVFDEVCDYYNNYSKSDIFNFMVIEFANKYLNKK